MDLESRAWKIVISSLPRTGLGPYLRALPFVDKEKGEVESSVWLYGTYISYIF